MSDVYIRVGKCLSEHEIYELDKVIRDFMDFRKDLQAQLDAANARYAELSDVVEDYLLNRGYSEERDAKRRQAMIKLLQSPADELTRLGQEMGDYGDS